MRIDYIDGIRGFFAILVVYIHYNALFYSTLPNGYYNSCEMVCGFFVLSGFVLSYRFWQNRDVKPLTSAAIRRYLRLTISPLITVLIAYVMMKSNLFFHHETCSVAQAWHHMDDFYKFIPTFRGALYEGLWGMYFSFNQITSYNPVLWTMSVELKGSFLSLAFLALFGKIKNRHWLYLIFILLTFDNLYLCFVFGIMFADMIYSEEGKKIRAILKEKNFISWIMFFASFFFAYYAFEVDFWIYRKMNLDFFVRTGLNVEQFYHIISAVMFVYAVIQLEILQKIFGLKFFKKFGEYSYSLYLIHVPILFSLGGYVFLKFFHFGFSMAVCIFAGTFIGLLATLPATYLLHHFADLPSGRLAKRFEKFFQ